MLRRENELRLCAETQEKFKAVSSQKKPDGWLSVVEQLQRQVCKEFGLSEIVGLTALRCAQDLLPNDPDVNEISLYRKYNRCRDGNLKVFDKLPTNVKLVHFNSQDEVLMNDVLVQSSTPTVVFAGSYT